MSQQTINIGLIANDGTGDPVRTAFSKANSNFNELYSRLDIPSPSGQTNKFLTNNGSNLSWNNVTIETLLIQNNLSFPVNSSIHLNGGLITQALNKDLVLTSKYNSAVDNFGTYLVVEDELGNNKTLLELDHNSARIRTDVQNSDYQWEFGDDGHLTIPNYRWIGTGPHNNIKFNHDDLLGSSVVIRTTELNVSPTAERVWDFAKTGVTTVPGSIIPNLDIEYDLGSPTNRFKDLYLSGNSISIGGSVITHDGSGGLIFSGGVGITTGLFRVTNWKNFLDNITIAVGTAHPTTNSNMFSSGVIPGPFLNGASADIALPLNAQITWDIGYDSNGYIESITMIDPGPLFPANSGTTESDWFQLIWIPNPAQPVTPKLVRQSNIPPNPIDPTKRETLYNQNGKTLYLDKDSSLNPVSVTGSGWTGSDVIIGNGGGHGARLGYPGPVGPIEFNIPINCFPITVEEDLGCSIFAQALVEEVYDSYITNSQNLSLENINMSGNLRLSSVSVSQGNPGVGLPMVISPDKSVIQLYEGNYILGNALTDGQILYLVMAQNASSNNITVNINASRIGGVNYVSRDLKPFINNCDMVKLLWMDNVWHVDGGTWI